MASKKPKLFLMLGYPGAGKTTAAKLIAKHTNALHIWADEHRRSHYPEPHYSEAENTTLYNKLNTQAATALLQGKSVVYDTAFNHFADREKLRNIATAANADAVVVWVQTPRAVARERALNADQHPETRVLGDMTDEHFGRLSDKLEEPRSSETVINLDGTQLSAEYIASKLT